MITPVYTATVHVPQRLTEDTPSPFDDATEISIDLFDNNSDTSSETPVVFPGFTNREYYYFALRIRLRGVRGAPALPRVPR